MSASQLPPIPPNIAELTGPLFLGHIFNWGLFGALTVQVYIYYLAFPRDRALPKVIVSAVYVLELAQTVLSTRDSFRNFGTGWGNMADLDTVGWLWFSVPVLGSIICCVGQLFYAWRIWILSHRSYITVVIVLIALVQLGTGIYSGAVAHIIGDFSKLQMQTFQKTAVWLGSAALNDVIIATCMIYYLQRAKTGLRHTNTLITRFIRLTLETGLLCAAFAILDLSFYCAFQQNNYHLAPSIPLSKLYSNSLLVVLNARVHIAGGRNGITDPASLSCITTTNPSDSSPPQSRYEPPHNKTRTTSVPMTFSHEHGDLELHVPMTDRMKYNADGAAAEAGSFVESDIDKGEQLVH